MNDRLLTREPGIQKYVLNMAQKLVPQVDLKVNGYDFSGPHKKYDYLFYLDEIEDLTVDAKIEIVQERISFNGYSDHHKCLREKIEHITCLVYALSVFIKPKAF